MSSKLRISRDTGMYKHRVGPPRANADPVTVISSGPSTVYTHILVSDAAVTDNKSENYSQCNRSVATWFLTLLGPWTLIPSSPSLLALLTLCF